VTAGRRIRPLLEADDLVATDARIDDGPHTSSSPLGVTLLAVGVWPVIVDAGLVRVELTSGEDVPRLQR
jgi:hypothetical protein